MVTRMRKKAAGAGHYLLLVWVVGLSGCAGLGFLSVLFGEGMPVPAVYELEDRPTLIIVDDPQDLLGDLTLAGMVANNISFHLQENEAITTGIIDQQQLHQLAQRLGTKYPATPIDYIGKTLGAEQVIYLRINSLSLGIINSVYHQQCTAQVKLIDAQNRKRLFPSTSALIDSTTVPPGHPIEVTMNYQSTDSVTRGRAQESIIARQLAQRIGLEVAQLFYKHNDPPVGSTIKNH